jgi:hypothetical protein
MSMRSKILFGAFLTISLLPLQARAHFCDDLWTSSYNIVVRPEADTVTLSASGSGTMSISVQNNMGFSLTNFVLTAKIGSTAITATRQAGKITGTTLHPGERGQYTLAVTGTGGGSVKIESVSFFVSFGNSGENKCYPTQGGQAVMVKKTDGTMVPTGTPPGLATIVAPGGGCTGELTQARQLQYAAQTDFIDVNAGLDKLMTYYCAGRGSWNQNSDAVTAAACTGTAVDCTKATRSLGAGNGTKYDYAHLWGALELAVRKNSLGTRLAPLRLGLQCGAGDANTGFAGFAMMMLGYLGDDPGARTFLTGKAGGSGDLATIAKAALLLFGTAADKTNYEAAVTAGLTGDVFVSAACAAALGIVENDDAHVTSVLVPAAKWAEPDTSDNGQGFYAAHLLALVAWDRRGWAAAGADKGTVSFYESGTTPTGGSTGTGGTTGAGGSGGSTGAGGSSARGGSGGTPVGGSTSAGGSTARGGSTGTAAGGSTGTPVGGSTAAGGSTVAGGSTARGGSTGTPAGGNTATPAGGSTGTPAGGSTGTPAGGSTGTPAGGSTATPAGGSTGTPAGGSQGSSSITVGGGNTGAGTSANTGSGSSAQGGNGGSPSSGTASHSGSAGGCGYAPSGRAPLGFLLAGVGLALALRRRRR